MAGDLSLSTVSGSSLTEQISSSLRDNNETSTVGGAFSQQGLGNDEETLGLYADVPTAAYMTLGSVLFIGFIFGLVINPLVMNLFKREKKLQSLTNMYVLSLSFSDLLMTLVGLSTSAVANMYGRWVFGHTGCVLHGVTVTFLGLSNLNLLTAIAVDRYLAIVRPQMRALLGRRAIKVVITGCFTLAFAWSLIPLIGLFGVSGYTYEGIGTSCSLNWASERVADKTYICILFVVFFALPVSVICLSYSSIYYKVYQTHAEGSALAGGNSTIAAKNASLERKLALTFVMVFVSFLVSWTPYAVVSLMVMAGGAVTPLVAAVPAVLAKMAVVWNPIIYVLTNQIIRECFVLLYIPNATPTPEHLSGVVVPSHNFGGGRLAVPPTPSGLILQHENHHHSPARKQQKYPAKMTQTTEQWVVSQPPGLYLHHQDGGGDGRPTGLFDRSAPTHGVDQPRIMKGRVASLGHLHLSNT